MIVAILTPEEMVDRLFEPLDMGTPLAPDAQHLEAIGSAASGCWTTCVATIREFALDCLRLGWDCCSERFDGVRTFVEKEVSLLGDQADEVTDLLRRQLHEVLNNYVEYASSLIPLETTVGGETLTLSNVDVSYKIVVSGSVGLSLEGLFKVIGQGEVAIVGTYSR